MKYEKKQKRESECYQCGKKFFNFHAKYCPDCRKFSTSYKHTFYSKLQANDLKIHKELDKLLDRTGKYYMAYGHPYGAIEDYNEEIILSRRKRLFIQFLRKEFNI